jgi:hypothetical protein
VLFRDVPCRYCYKSISSEGQHDCVRRVTPAKVASVTLELLASGTTGGVSADGGAPAG